ncbi:MAG: ABC transporter permease subunit [Polyangiaceae bacterium]|nr:ABC transporter permease subunit [Polyangiaceae bacterium]
MSTTVRPAPHRGFATPAERALFRLELSEALRSRWLVFVGVVYLAVFGGFVWLGMRESTVLGFTGVSRVVLNLSNAVVLALPLVALIATAHTVVRARTSGFFELFLTQPCRRSEWYAAALAARVVTVVGPLVLVLCVALAVGLARGEPEVAPLVARTLAVSLALIWAYVGLGFWISARARTPERATVLALFVWLLGAALHDFALLGVLLQAKLSPPVVFTLAALNPVEAARLAILSGIDPELSVLGPVGFWLANTLGAKWTLLVGVGWPALVGTLGVGLGLRRLQRDDLVA